MSRKPRGFWVWATLFILVLGLLAWAPWLNNRVIYEEVRRTRAIKDGTYGWVIYPDGTRKREWICDYRVMWVPFGRWVASCEGAYYVTFWGRIVP